MSNSLARAVLAVPQDRLLYEGHLEKVTVAARSLTDYGWTRVVASEEINLEDLGQVVLELSEDDCVHSWKSANLKRRPNGSLDLVGHAADLVAAEQARRPTRFLSYYGVTAAGEHELIGIATICDRVSKQFGHEGFPVISRCYVRKKFRGSGLYRGLLWHRVELCHKIYGEALSGIHLGTATPSVLLTVLWRAVGARGFVYVGNENLAVAHQTHDVKDFLYFTTGFEDRLRAQIRDSGPELNTVVEDLFAGKLGPQGYGTRLWPAYTAQLSALADRDVKFSSSPLQQLIDMMDAIPVTRTPGAPSED